MENVEYGRGKMNEPTETTKQNGTMTFCSVYILYLCSELSYLVLSTSRKTQQCTRFCYLHLFQSVGVDGSPACLSSRDSGVKL